MGLGGRAQDLILGAGEVDKGGRRLTLLTSSLYDGINDLGSGLWPEGNGVASSPAPDPHLHQITRMGRVAFSWDFVAFLWKLEILCPRREVGERWVRDR